jgi:hypothetical protein
MRYEYSFRKQILPFRSSILKHIHGHTSPVLSCPRYAHIANNCLQVNNTRSSSPGAEPNIKGLGDKNKRIINFKENFKTLEAILKF